MKNEIFQNTLSLLYVHREDNSIKNDYGKTCLIGGSVKYPHAISLAASLSSVSGVGFTAVEVPQEIYPIVASSLYPTQIFEFSKDFDYLNQTYSSILFGNGMEENKENQEFLTSLLLSYEHELIIDATGLSLLSKEALHSHKGNILLTPHLGEARKLLQVDKKSRDPKDYLKETIAFCKSERVSILLKSSSSILVNEKGEVYESSYPPCPGLAKAGSGDGLAGYLAGLLAYGTKKEKRENIILFGDEMIHRAALRATKQYSSGIVDILYAKEEIVKIIEERRTK